MQRWGWTTALAGWLAVHTLGAPAAGPTFQEHWRPQFHFTPPSTWMNDPNGMVYYDGEYHLFYQNNPVGDRWGHMSWAHAVSRDLTHWEHLPLALAEENGVMIFSGSAVVDWKNTSGFGRDGRPPLVAIYTGHHTTKPLQNQQIAFSNDRGRTWTKYSGNPVLDLGEADFRDPKVFWHASTGRWVMAVSWPQHRQVRFYASANLKSWTHLSDFGPAGSVAGIWECPDLFPVPVEGQPGKSRWVLVVNVGSGQPAGGSGTQYFVGEFDGTRFVADAGDGALWADHGSDFYAGVSWSDVPERDGRRLWLGWMSNWTYANDVPTAPWRSAMSVPRELQVRGTPAGWRLIQKPVRELQQLRGPAERVRHVALDTANAWLAQRRFPTGLAEVELTLDRVPTSGSLTWECRYPGGAVTRVIADFGASEIRVDRTSAGRSDFSPTFAGVHRGPLRIVDGRLDLRMLLDTSSLEVFAQGGETVLTDLILPPSPELRFAITAAGRGRETRIASLSLRPLKSALPLIHTRAGTQ